MSYSTSKNRGSSKGQDVHATEINPSQFELLPESIKIKLRKSVLAETKLLHTSKSFGVVAEKKHQEVKVIPELEQIDFYDGDRLPIDQYVPQSAGTRKRHGNQSSVRTRRATHLHEILNNLRGQICFVGPAGSGKTTLLKAITRDVVQGKYENLKDMEIVHFINCRQFGKSERITPGKLLFQGMKENLSDEEIEKLLEVAQSNSSKVLLVLDSLDTLPYPLDGEHGMISLHEESTPPTILWNLLAVKLIPGCRIITSSREHAIKDFEGDLRARKIIALSGLTDDSIEHIIDVYLGKKKTESTMKYIKLTSPTLKSLCSVPVFLVYTLIGIENKLDFKPKTMSGIMVLLLKCFMRSEHAQATNIEVVINRLKLLSFDGTKQGKVLFSKDELKARNLEEKEVTDVSVQAPGGGEQTLMKKNSLFFFSHQSIQETLTALYIAEMKLNEFKSFVEKHIHKPHYCVVRRILCGLLLDSQVTKESNKEERLLSEKELSIKGDILKDSLQTQMQRTDEMNAVDRLELFTSINEAQDGMNDVIDSSLEEINLYNLSLALSDIHVIGSILSRCKDVKLLRLFQCGMYPELFAILESSIRYSDVKIENLDLVCNPMNISAIGNVGKIVERHDVKSLDVRYCNLNSEHLEKFSYTLKKSKISKLNVRCNEFSVDAMQYLAQIVKQSEVRELILSYATLTANHLKKFKEHLDANFRVEMLDIGAYLLETYHASPEEVNAIIDLLPHVEKELRIDGWILQPGDKSRLKRKLDALYPTKLEVSFGDYRRVATFVSEDTSVKKRNLDFSDSTLTHDDMETVARFIRGSSASECVCTVRLKNCNLDGEILNAFTNRILNCKAQVEKLDLSFNKGGIGVVGTIARQLQLKHLDPNHCPLDKDDLGVPETSLAGYQLNLIIGDSSEEEKHLSLPGQIPMQSEEDAPPIAEISDEDFEEEKKMEEAEGSVELTEDLQQDFSPDVIKSRKHPVPDTGCDAKENSPSPSKKVRNEESDINTREKTEKEELRTLIQIAQSSPAINLCYENGDSVINEISLQRCASPSDPVTVAKIIKRCESLELLEFDSCELDNAQLEQFYNEIKESKCQITEIAFVNCKNVASWVICDMITKFDVVSLRLESCNISDECFRPLKEKLQKNLKELDISRCKGVTSDVFIILADIIDKQEISKLRLSDCGLTDDLLREISKLFAKKAKSLEELIIDCSEDLSATSFKNLAKIVRKCEIRKLAVYSCEITEDMISSFNDAVGEAKIHKFGLSYSVLDEECVAAFGVTVRQCEVKEVGLAGCKMTGTMIRAFHSTAKGTKLKFLNLSDNRLMQYGIKAVAELVKRSNLVNLDLSDCMLSCRQIEIFAEMLGEAKCTIQKLDLSDYVRHVNLEYIKRICQLLPHVVDELRLIILEMDSNCIQELQDKLDSLPECKLKVHLAEDTLSRKTEEADLSASPGTSKEYATMTNEDYQHELQGKSDISHKYNLEAKYVETE